MKEVFLKRNFGLSNFGPPLGLIIVPHIDPGVNSPSYGHMIIVLFDMSQEDNTTQVETDDQDNVQCTRNNKNQRGNNVCS